LVVAESIADKIAAPLSKIVELSVVVVAPPQAKIVEPSVVVDMLSVVEPILEADMP
jgi:hypothetical protein